MYVVKEVVIDSDLLGVRINQERRVVCILREIDVVLYCTLFAPNPRPP